MAKRFHKLPWLVLPLLALVLAGARCDEPPETRPLYIALGDSLSAGVGASSPDSTGFVPLVRRGLNGKPTLLNLGLSGDRSLQLLEGGRLDIAIGEIESRLTDGDDANDVELVTLEIGGNDILALYFGLVLPGTCPDVDALLTNETCSNALRSALDGFQTNFAQILDRLIETDPDLHLVVMTLFNPFSHLGPIGELGDVSLEGRAGTPFPEGLNDLIRAEANQRGLTVVDLYHAFQGKTDRLISSDLIHPNDEGYRTIADAVLAAIDE